MIISINLGSVPAGMSNKQFREDQLAHLEDPHIAPITEYIELLRAQGYGHVPYVAPHHGGVEARLLGVLRDPGPATQEAVGSGMLSVENDDQTAAAQRAQMLSAGIPISSYIPWNAYPWYVNRAPTREELGIGAEALHGLLARLPLLEVVLLQGTEAQRAWMLMLDQYPEVYLRRLQVISTYHPSIGALRAPNEQERQRRIAHREARWRIAGALLSEENMNSVRLTEHSNIRAPNAARCC